METNERITKPASDDPQIEAKSHPNGPSLIEMLSGQEEIKLSSVNPLNKKPGEAEDPEEEAKS